MKPSETLRRTRDLLGQPNAWAHGDFAFDAAGELVGPCDDHAVCWCLIGGLCKVLGVDRADERAVDEPYGYVQRAIERVRGWAIDDVAEFNDDLDTGLPDVLAVLDDAAALAESEGQ